MLPAPAYAQPDCAAFNQQLQWPIGGVANKDWVVPYYKDLDPTNEKRDYRGVAGSNARTYDQHRGIDIVVPTFKWVDDNLPVYAAAAGKVITVNDGQEDRNTVQDGSKQSNLVELTHQNGFRTIYAHLKKNSIVVSPDQQVKQGQLLGTVGSSGNSSWPHLHFEVQDCELQSISSMRNDMWRDAPDYEIPFTLLDLILLRGGPASDLRQRIIYGGEDALTFNSSEVIVVSPIVAGGLVGDSLTLEVRYPDGNLYEERSRVFEKSYGGSYWYWYFSLPDDFQGLMDVVIRLNGDLASTTEIQIY